MHRPPALLVLVEEGPREELFCRIEELRKAWPHTPLLLLGKSLTRNEIIRAYESGASKLLLLPEEDPALTEAMAQLGRWNDRGWSWGWVLKKGWMRVKNWFQKRSSGLQAGTSMGFVPEVLTQERPAPGPAQEVDLRANLFGELEVFWKGTKIQDFPGKKAASLLAFLLFHHRKPVHKEKLMEQFWSYSTPCSARNSLNVALHKIRKTFKAVGAREEVLLYDEGYYQINPELRLEIDVVTFLRCWQMGLKAERLAGLEEALPHFNQAAALYTGDFLENLPYEDWT
ncbi:MAG: hypothetical protein D6765_12450, partial [Bacteroidetes bacterium]